MLGLPDKGRAFPELLCSLASIYNLLYVSLDNRKVRGLVPYCGQDDFQAQVSKHLMNTYRYISYQKISYCF